MAIITGLSGNEIYCLAEKGYKPGNIVVGNSVHSLGFLGLFKSSLKSIAGGELTQVTQLIEDGRITAYKRMLKEASSAKANGITGVTSELIFHGGNIEFLSVGSMVHAINQQQSSQFSTVSDGQELYAQLDAGFKPMSFVFGNVAYSMGIGRGILGGLKSFARGEVKEYSHVFNHTRYLALERIVQNAKRHRANAVLGISTSILPFGAFTEMLMIGTASYHNELTTSEVITSDLTNVEMWNLIRQGYMPLKLVMGTSIYSLGFVGGITSIFKGFIRSEITELTNLIYEARENALGLINTEANEIGADDVVGVKTYIYNLGGGLVEFLVIGTAVKKMPHLQTQSDQLPPQAIIVDRDMFYQSKLSPNVSLNLGNKASFSRGIFTILIIFFYIIIFVFFKTHR